MRARTLISSRGAAAVLDFQMWCWGQDVHHPAGNQLLAAGLTRVRPPAGVHGSTLYQTALPEGRTLCLWGFAIGVLVPDESCLLLKRHGFALRLVPAARFPTPLWQPTALPMGHLPRDDGERHLALARFAMLADWMAGYEASVQRCFGAHWRHVCAARRPRGQRHRLPVPPDTLAQTWRRLRDNADVLLPTAGTVRPISLAS
jgi:hypothetical protein